MKLKVLEWAFQRSMPKVRVAAYMAVLPSNGRRDDEIADIVNKAYGGKKHIHGNPVKKEVGENGTLEACGK